jgi:ubiquinone/menaquinone biosynthesis C-methylase UbiE
MSTDSPANLDNAVQKRYAALADGCGSLSCGGALDLASAKEGEVLVDLGSGRGADVIRAARQVGPRGQAIGVDRTQAMIDKARSAAPSDLANVRFVPSDLAALAVDSASADVVISNCTINHAPDKAAVYREIHRILRPGGRFVVSDIIAEDVLPASVRNDPEAWAACYGGAIPEDEYRAAMTAGGFPQVEVLQQSKPYQKGGVTIRSMTFRGYKGLACRGPIVEEGEE